MESPKSHREGNSGMSSATSSGPASTISERREDFPAEAMVPVSLTSPEEKPRILPTRCRLARRGSGRKDGAHGGSTRLIRSHSSPVSPSLDMPGKARSIRSRNRHQTRAASSSKASNGAAKRSARQHRPPSCRKLTVGSRLGVDDRGQLARRLILGRTRFLCSGGLSGGPGWGIPMVEDLPERYVPAAHETLAWDQLPDHEPLTHLKPLR